jgi:hypothetical protein
MSANRSTGWRIDLDGQPWDLKISKSMMVRRRIPPAPANYGFNFQTISEIGPRSASIGKLPLNKRKSFIHKSFGGRFMLPDLNIWESEPTRRSPLSPPDCQYVQNPSSCPDSARWLRYCLHFPFSISLKLKLFQLLDHHVGCLALNPWLF